MGHGRDPQTVLNRMSPMQRKTLESLLRQNIGRNEIARRMGLYQEDVTAAAHGLGHSFVDVRRTLDAVEVNRARAAERLVRINETNLAAIELLQAQLFDETTVYAFGGRDNIYREHKVDEPPSRDKVAIVTAITHLMDRAIRLQELRATAPVHEGRSVMAALQDALEVVVLPGDVPDTDDADDAEADEL